jgi:predicted heme/steroid binding protein
MIYNSMKSSEYCLMNERGTKYYSLAQLALRNGQDREEIWACYKGKIYDLTSSRMWANGTHYEHWAGQDLTEELKDAPHSEAVFKKFKIVGSLNISRT